MFTIFTQPGSLAWEIDISHSIFPGQDLRPTYSRPLISGPLGRGHP